MALVTALSAPVRLDRRDEILREALQGRRADLRQRWKQLISTECLGPLGSIGPQVGSFLSGQDSPRDWRVTAGFTWIDCDADFSDCLRTIALAGKFEYRPSDTTPSAFSPVDFNRLSGNERLEALRARYRCPLNIGAASELDLAEELLRQLMVPDRAKLEAGAEFDAGLILLKLNLIGIRAMITRELRCLDALNYFYELPHQSLTRMRANPPYFAFWLCIYAQLLSATDW